MFPEHTLTISLIAAFFVFIWAIKYPIELWKSLTFRNDNGLKGYLESIGIIIFFLGFVNCMIFIANRLNN